MVERTEYLKKLTLWKDEQVIKVVTGIRRCGKSTLLMQYQEHKKRMVCLQKNLNGIQRSRSPQNVIHSA